MKKTVLFLTAILLLQTSFAKKVQFVVNMSGQILSPNGIHVMGDFQALAGLGADWTPDNALMVKDLVDTNLYRLTVDIPAFQKYEYKFVNGDQSYEVEVVPVKARVGYDNVDNRWIYIDSLDNDTTILAELVFNQTSPAGYTMMRYIVDMTLQTVSPDGVHIAGDFQTWNPATDRLYSFGKNTYEIIVYGSLGTTYNYKFYNGNTAATAELVPAPCAVASNRALQLNADTIAEKVCFATCVTCYPLSVSSPISNTSPSIYPNPMNDYSFVEFNDNLKIHHIIIRDLLGRSILKFNDVEVSKVRIDKSVLQTGIYLVQILNNQGGQDTFKLSVE